MLQPVSGSLHSRKVPWELKANSVHNLIVKDTHIHTSGGSSNLHWSAPVGGREQQDTGGPRGLEGWRAFQTLNFKIDPGEWTGALVLCEKLQ